VQKQSELLAGDAVLIAIEPAVVPHRCPVEEVAASECSYRRATRPVPCTQLAHPCGYLLFTCVQFFHRRGMTSLAAPANGAPSPKALPLRRLVF
jgi:hypothetical protein